MSVDESSSVHSTTFSETKPEDWIRGSDLENIEQRCFDLCVQYIGGSWANASDPKKDLEVRRITGGLTNQLYYAALKPHVKRVPNSVYRDEPSEVTIRFYQKKHINNVPGNNERLSDTIIALVGSQLSVAPKVYGLFDGGVIQAYYKHENLKAKYQEDDRLARKLMHNLAAINLYPIPLPKTRAHLHQSLKKSIEDAYEFFKIPEKIHEYEFKAWIEHDVLKEFLDFEQKIAKLNMPLVFCHNDFRLVNVMVTDETEEEKDLVIIDFEYCCYGYRAHDIACIALDWGRNDYQKGWKPWVYSEEVIRRYAKFYLEGCDLLQPGYSSRPGNSLEDLILEIRVCLAENWLYLVALVLNFREGVVTKNKFDVKENLTMVYHLYQVYLQTKNQLVEDGILPK